AGMTRAQVGNAMSAAVDALHATQGNWSAAGQVLGSALAQGAAAGVTVNTPAIATAVASAVHAAVAAGQAAARAHSPSLEARDKIGAPLLEGIILGIDQLSSSVDTKLSTAVRDWINHATQV